MKTKVLAICDEEKKYAVKLAEAFCEKRNLGFQIYAFSDVEELEKFAAQNQIEILLVGGRLMSNHFGQFHIGKIILLSDGEIYEEFSDYENIYKYQSADRILKEILCCCAEYAKPVAGVCCRPEEVEIHGIYSPIGRCGKSALAAALAGSLGKYKKTLLLDLQSFSAHPEQLGEEELWDLADMIYFLRQGKKTFLYKLGSIVQNHEFYDSILPMRVPADLRSVTLAEWTELLEKLIAESDYQIIILDFGHEICGTLQLLNQCTKIYVPVLSDEDSQRKMRNFEWILKDEKFEKVLNCMYKINIPTDAEGNLKRFMNAWAERLQLL